MEKFVVAYSVNGNEIVNVMNGHALATLVGFSDCYSLDYCHVWKFNKDRMEMIPCRICPAMEHPLNRLYVEVLAGWTENYYYTWDVH